MYSLFCLSLKNEITQIVSSKHANASVNNQKMCSLSYMHANMRCA
jgi:hypothetical protein